MAGPPTSASSAFGVGALLSLPGTDAVQQGLLRGGDTSTPPERTQGTYAWLRAEPSDRREEPAVLYFRPETAIASVAMAVGFMAISFLVVLVAARRARRDALARRDAIIAERAAPGTGELTVGRFVTENPEAPRHHLDAA